MKTADEIRNNDTMALLYWVWSTNKAYNEPLTLKEIMPPLDCGMFAKQTVENQISELISSGSINQNGNGFWITEPGTENMKQWTLKQIQERN